MTFLIVLIGLILLGVTITILYLIADLLMRFDEDE